MNRINNYFCNISNKNATTSTIKLLERLKEVSKEGKFIFGHQNSNFISITSKYDSDVRAMVDDLPGLIGIDTLALAGIEMDKTSQEKSLKKSIEKCLEASKEGAIITLSAHMPNFSSKNIIIKNGRYYFNKCDFMDTKDKSNDCANEILPNGKYNEIFLQYLDIIVKFSKELEKNNISIIFRPWHEQNGNWFWWGKDIEKDTYINLYRYTREYLESKNVNNLLYVYSPNGPFVNEDDYMDRYPGDDYIDILAIDYYDDYMYGETWRDDYLNKLDSSCHIISKIADKHHKIAAISEVGVRVSKDQSNDDLNGLLEQNNPILGHDWFRKIGEIALKYKMPYYLVWGNFEKKNTYLPFIDDDGNKHELVDEFVNFYNWDKSLFCKNK